MRPMHVVYRYACAKWIYAGIDLNLLVALEALLDEKNVTRAAHGYGMSQPAASRALGRLRVLFSDALLVDGPGGYVSSVPKRCAPCCAGYWQAWEKCWKRTRSIPRRRRVKSGF